MMNRTMSEKRSAHKTTVNDVKLVPLPTIDVIEGSITAINSKADVHFDIKRIYYLYDVPNRADRGAHAHKNLHQLIIAALGSFEVEFFDGNETRKILLRQPDEGLYVPPGLWRDLKLFSGGAICLVLADMVYDESDYIRSMGDYLNFKRKS